MATWYNKYAAITLSAGAGLGAYVVVPWSNLTASDLGTWIGSIGTVGALTGTIWLATAETRRREAEMNALATLAAASILLKTARVNGLITTVKHRLEHEEMPPGEEALLYESCLANLAEVDRWTIEELVPLVPLPNHAAAKLAYVGQVLVTVELNLKLACTASIDNVPHYDAELIRQLGSAQRVLEAGIAECKRAVNKLGDQTDD